VVTAVVALLKLTQLSWPYAMDKTFNIVSLSLLKLGIAVQAQCWVRFDTAFYLRSYFPIGIAALLMLYYLTLLGVKRWDRETNHPERVRRIVWIFPTIKQIGFREPDYVYAVRSLLVRSFLSFLQVGYTYLSAEALVIFDCIEISGTERIRDFVLVECYSSRWWRDYLPTALFSILVYMIGILILLLTVLRRYKFGESPGSRDILGGAIMDYRKGYRWWPLVDMVWRLTIVIVIRFGISNPPAQISAFLFLLLVRILAHRVLTPFENSMPNTQEIVLIAFTIGVATCGVAFYIMDSSTHVPRGVTTLLYVVAILCIVGMLSGTAWYVWRSYQEFNRTRADGMLRRSTSRSSKCGGEDDDIALTQLDGGSEDRSRVFSAAATHMDEPELDIRYVPLPAESSEAKRFHQAFLVEQPDYEHADQAAVTLESRRFDRLFTAVEEAYVVHPDVDSLSP